MPGQSAPAVVSAITPQILDALPKLGESDAVVQLARNHAALIDKLMAERYAPDRLLELAVDAEDALQAKLTAEYEREHREAQTAHVSTLRRAQTEAQGRADTSQRAGETQSEKLDRLEAALVTTRRDSHVVAQLSLLRDVESVDELLEAYGDAELSRDPFAIRAIGRAVELRLKVLEAQAYKERPKNVPNWVNPVALGRAKFTKGFDAWRANNPTPRERIAHAERDLASLTFSTNHRYNRLIGFLKLDLAGRTQRGMQPRKPQPAPVWAAFTE